MKIFLLADYYKAYLQSFYSRSDLSRLNYSDHREMLFNDYFGSFVSYYRYFQKLGHRVELVIGNDFLLQNKWLKEHKINGVASEVNKQDVVLSQIEHFQPDVFFIGSMFDYYGDFLKKISCITRNIFAWISCPFSNNLDFSNIRCIVSSAQMFVNRFREKGLNSELLKAAFDPDILNFLDNRSTIDVSFIGTLSKNTHRRRVEGIESLIRKGVGVNVYGLGLKRSMIPFFRSPIEKHYMGQVWGKEMYQTLNHSKISLNFHIDVANDFSGNMRMYESTGCGSLLMTEHTSGLEDLFKVDKEVISFKCHEDLRGKIEYFLSHDNERKEIAENGQKACIHRHGYTQRIKEFNMILEDYCE